MHEDDPLTGLALARQFFHEAVAPIVARVAPALRYTAGRFGARSDALGFDDATSRDHGWGPGCMLLIDPAPAAFDDLAATLDTALRNELPIRFRGYSTSYRHGQLSPIEQPPVDHDVEIATPENFLSYHLGVPAASALRALDWLVVDEQKLVELTCGELFRDDLGFAATRHQLAYYPDDLRLHLIAVEWLRIAEEQAFPARAGSRGDDAGSAIISARLAESAMRLAFYLERRYPPYAKWFGTAFQRLPCGPRLHGPIARLLTAQGWQQRDREWAAALAHLVQLHEETGLLEPGKYRPAPVYAGRPGTGLPALESSGLPTITELVDDLRARITDPDVLALPRRLGSINQVVACRDLEDDPSRWRARLAALHRSTST